MSGARPWLLGPPRAPASRLVGGAAPRGRCAPRSPVPAPARGPELAARERPEGTPRGARERSAGRAAWRPGVAAPVTCAPPAAAGRLPGPPATSCGQDARAGTGWADTAAGGAGRAGRERRAAAGWFGAASCLSALGSLTSVSYGSRPASFPGRARRGSETLGVKFPALCLAPDDGEPAYQPDARPY